MTPPTPPARDKAISISDALLYEVHSSWWAGSAPRPLHGLAAWWFARKARRKHGRYLASLAERERVLARGDL